MDDLLNKKYSSGVSVVKAKEEHIDHIAKNLRKQDRREVHLIGSTPEEGMKLGVEFDDETYTILTKDKKPCGMFGVGQYAIDEGYIWMLGTDEIYNYKQDFIRFSRPWINKIASNYPKYSNTIHSKNYFSLRWLMWCGATLVENVDINGETFFKFSIFN